MRVADALRRLAVVVALVCTACAGSSDVTPSRSVQPADLVLRGGAVYTLDAVRSWAEAVAIRGERIVYVGSDAGVARVI